MSGGSAFDKAVGHTETKLETESYGLEHHFLIIFPSFSHSRGQAMSAMPHFQKNAGLEPPATDRSERRPRKGLVDRWYIDMGCSCLTILSRPRSIHNTSTVYLLTSDIYIYTLYTHIYIYIYIYIHLYIYMYIHAHSLSLDTYTYYHILSINGVSVLRTTP